MKIKLFTLSLCLISLSDAGLADTPSITNAPSKEFSWTGAYVGAHVGGLMQDGDLTLNPYPGPPPYHVAWNSNLNGSSAIGGLLLGYTHQINWLALGLEGDVGWMNASSNVTSGSAARTNIDGYTSNKLSQDINGHVRGRIGYASGPMLVFVAGGLAVTSTKLNLEGYYPLEGAITEEASQTLVGGSIGGGAEYAIKNNLLVRAEYIYDDYGSVQITPGDFWQNRQLNLSNNTLRAAISYKF
jgi:outer membrane immunogenic protein